MSIQELALELQDYLAPACTRIEIAGSIRRGKVNPKDIELLAISRKSDVMQELDLFGNVTDEIYCDHLHGRLQELYSGKRLWQLDSVLKRNGPKYKRLRHVGMGVCCDLFITTPEQWGCQFIIRTGPADFSQAMVTRALQLGMKVDGGRLWKTHRDGSRTAIFSLTEYDVFDALKIHYIEPASRSVATLNKGIYAPQPARSGQA